MFLKFLKRFNCHHDNRKYCRIYRGILTNGKYIAEDICKCSDCGKVIWKKIKYNIR